MGMLDLGGGYSMYYEEHGTPTGKPVVILHGGPGGGLDRKHKRYFNQKQWRIIMFDQRGCGKSLPRGLDSLAHNTTWDLVRDIEILRKHLAIDTWVVFGGSWGTTLGLAYAETHPSSVSGLILRGVSLMGKWEHEWLYGGGMAALWPDVWEKFEAGSKGSQGTTKKGSLMKRYTYLLKSKRRHTRRAAAKAWWGTEHAISFLKQQPDNTPDKEVEELAILENHYYRHNAWLDYNQLLKNATKLKGIPVHIVQGRYDSVCPLRAAWELSKRLDNVKLTIIPDAGHGGSEPGTMKALRRAINSFLV